MNSRNRNILRTIREVKEILNHLRDILVEESLDFGEIERFAEPLEKIEREGNVLQGLLRDFEIVE
jgi:hypothetical protein